MPQPLVSVIVPTYNSERLLTDFFQAFLSSTFTNFEIIVNDDVRSTDNTKVLVASFRAQGLDITYLQENQSMAQGRKRGAAEARGDILLHLDSDMQVTAPLLEECVQKIKSGYDALVIPEEAYGTTFWAKCKWLEKKMYEGVEQIESLRCIRRELYESVGGHDIRMVFSEDKDLDIRVRESGAKVGRTTSYLRHNEGELQLLKTLRKKQGYSFTANIFADAHPEHFRWQSNPFNRYIIFLRNVKYFFRHPLTYTGVWYMKTCEFLWAGLGMAFAR